MFTFCKSVRVLGATSACVVGLLQGCGHAVSSACDGLNEAACAQSPEQSSALADKPMPSDGYVVKWSTCTDFVEGNADVLTNSRVVLVADDGTVPIMRVEPIEHGDDNVRRMHASALPKGMQRGEGLLHRGGAEAVLQAVTIPTEDGLVNDDGSNQRAPARSHPSSTSAPQNEVAFVKIGQAVTTIERDGSVVQWVISSESLGEPVENEHTGKLEYQDTCFRNPSLVGRDTSGYIAPSHELATSCVVEEMNMSYNSLSVGGYQPLVNWADLDVPCANDPQVRPHPDNPNYVGFDRGAFLYRGFGAALNDINGAEREPSSLYWEGDYYCHMIVSSGLEVPGAKRPATKSLPLPGVVNEATFIVWRPVNPNVAIANGQEPTPPPVVVEAPAQDEPVPAPAEAPAQDEPVPADN